jgi:serine/threonine-protein kinase
MKGADDPKYAEANSLLKQALVIQERIYGSGSVPVAYVLNSLGAAADYGHHYPQAEDYFQRVSNIYKSAYSASDYRYAVALANLASIYQQEKQYTQAESLLTQAIQINTAALGATNINTAVAQIKLGRVLEHENRFREAVPHTLAGFEALIHQTSPDTDFVQGASKDLILAYGKLNEPQKAEEIKRTVASIATKAHP